jgi:hypothetical protein
VLVVVEEQESGLQLSFFPAIVIPPERGLSFDQPLHNNIRRPLRFVAL